MKRASERFDKEQSDGLVRDEGGGRIHAPHSPDRRAFLKGVGSASSVLIASAALPLEAASAPHAVRVAREEASPASRRAAQVYRMRREAALRQRNLPPRRQRSNGDEALYPNLAASFSKGLPHNRLGEVDVRAYGLLRRALSTGTNSDFEKIPLGGTQRLGNPQAAFAIALDGPDSHYHSIAPPPAFNSAEQAFEMAELYWQAVTRDVPFAEYETNPLTRAAASELSEWSALRDARNVRPVTAGTLFRGHTRGDLVGPYVSQFLWKDVPQGALRMPQRIRTAEAEGDHLNAFDQWLAVQSGGSGGAATWDAVPRYVRNGRDLAEYVHGDFTYQAFLHACLILLGVNNSSDPSNPYRNSRTQSGFSTFGAPHVLDAVARAANCGLRAAWHQKWLVHRRLRPEEFGGRVHVHKTRAAAYDLHPAILKSPVPELVRERTGSYLLPQAYPEGCPLHPAYPAGHAVIAGACATVLKLFFDEKMAFPDPVVATPDGTELKPYAGPALTLGGELDKLASNIAIGRNIAGVHWASDGFEGLSLGEAIAIDALGEMRGCFNETYSGFSLTKFDGTVIMI